MIGSIQQLTFYEAIFARTGGRLFLSLSLSLFDFIKENRASGKKRNIRAARKVSRRSFGEFYDCCLYGFSFLSPLLHSFSFSSFFSCCSFPPSRVLCSAPLPVNLSHSLPRIVELATEEIIEEEDLNIRLPSLRRFKRYLNTLALVPMDWGKLGRSLILRRLKIHLPIRIYSY